MHSGVLVNARPLHKVLSLGHVWLFLLVCACWGNTGLVRREGGAVGQWASDPLPGRNAPSPFPGPLRGAGMGEVRTGPLRGGRALPPCREAGGW